MIGQIYNQYAGSENSSDDRLGDINSLFDICISNFIMFNNLVKREGNLNLTM